MVDAVFETKDVICSNLMQRGLDIGIYETNFCECAENTYAKVR